MQLFFTLVVEALHQAASAPLNSRREGLQSVNRPCTATSVCRLDTQSSQGSVPPFAGQLFSTLVIQALQGLQQLSAYDNNPDMADDTFLLIGRGVRYSPGVVFNAHMLPIIVDAAMSGVLVQHR